MKAWMWPISIGFCMGVLFALPLAAPVLGSVIPDAAATLWGSALGAIGAVAAAMWVSQIGERNTRRNAGALVLEMVEPISFFLDELSALYGEPTDRENHVECDIEPDFLSREEWGEVRSAATHVIDRLALLQRRTHRIESVLPLLGPRALGAYFAFETEVESVERVARKLESDASPAKRMYGGGPSWSLRFALRVHAGHIRTSVEQIRLAVK